ncbi:hypothetical protein M758_4G203000 [Ceratodon purpureus]|nr:hypothetical protein M758_4G203000 [Ceratodon purpureus]
MTTLSICACSLESRVYVPGVRLQFTRGSRSFLQLRRVRVVRSGLGEVEGEKKEKVFVYSRARPEVRWPGKSGELNRERVARESENAGRVSSRVMPDWEELSRSDERVREDEEGGEGGGFREGQASVAGRLEREEMLKKREAFRQRQKGQARRLQSMSKLALRKATDFQNKARRLATAICALEMERPVSDVLDDWPEQLNNDEMSAVVRNVGDKNWRRALEFYEWLNLQKWYTPNPRLLATILHILGRANQLEAARELFLNAEAELTSCIQVFNAILGVYARQGQWQAAKHILDLMTFRGCEPDIVTFNTIANARCKHGLQSGMASALLREIESAGLRPDIITYNTLLGGCIAMKYFVEASDIVKEMEQRGFDLDACTSYVSGKKYLNLDEGEGLVSSVPEETSQQQAPSNNGVKDFSDDDSLRQASPSTETMQNYGETSSDSLHNPNRELKESLNISDLESKEVSTPHFVAGRGTAEKNQLVLRREHVLGGKSEAIVKDFCYKSQLKMCTSTTGGLFRQTEGVLMELWRQTEYLRLLFGRGMVQKECESSPEARLFYVRVIEAEIKNFFSMRGMNPTALKKKRMLRTCSQVWYHPSQFRLLEFFLLVLLKHALKLMLSCRPLLCLNNIPLKTITPLVDGNMRKYVMSNINRIESSGLQAGDPHQMFRLNTYFSDATLRPEDESRFSVICLFMQWTTVYVMSPVVECMGSLGCGQVSSSKRPGSRKFRPCRMHTSGWILGDRYYIITTKSYRQLHLCKAAQAPDTGDANYMLSDVKKLDSDVVQADILVTKEERVGSVSALSCTRLINECMMKKDYASGLEQLTKMVNAGIEPGYMTWISVLQACVQCANRLDLLRLLAALRDAGCPLPLRIIMERDAAMLEVEIWLRNLQGTAADAGQGMVNVLLDILWAFKLRSTASHLYDLAVHLDVYPKNFAKVEEQNWEADFRNLSPGTALIALNHWFIEMQKASLDGFPEPPKEVLMVTGTQGYQNGVSLNKTIRAHLWEMGSPFYMRPPREGALITKGHALLLWLKDSPRCFNLELEDSIIIPKENSMSFFKGAWMSSDAVPVMTQIHTSIGEVWPRKYSKLAHMTETRRIEALAARIENEKRRRLEKRDQPAKKKKKQSPRRKEY